MDNVQNNSHVEPQFHLLNGTNLTAPTFINHNYAPQVFQPPNNIESSNIPQPQINPENNNEEHKKRKRATKKESDVTRIKVFLKKINYCSLFNYVLKQYFRMTKNKRKNWRKKA